LLNIIIHYIIVQKRESPSLQNLWVKKMSYAKNLNGSKNRLLYVIFPLYFGAKCSLEMFPWYSASQLCFDFDIAITDFDLFLL